VSVILDPDHTRALLEELPAAYRTEIEDALLAALAQAFRRWTGSPVLLVDLEGHGREDLWEDVDLSRTVGWFTSLHPLRLDLRQAPGPGEALQVVKEQRRAVPGGGIGYGLLRYLDPESDCSRQLSDRPRAQVSFNYLGRYGEGAGPSSPLRIAGESRGPERDPRGKRIYLLEIDGGITAGSLQLEWSYSRNLHQRATIEQLAGDYLEALRALIQHSRSPEAGGYTASDFADFGWSQDDLDDILSEIGKTDWEDSHEIEER
jgi:non-ribosomal peptide synthase protein (TIGR01720 family)